MISARLIRSVRQELGLTQTELGARLGITQRAVCRYESGSRIPDVTTLIALADLCLANGLHVKAIAFLTQGRCARLGRHHAALRLLAQMHGGEP